MPWKSYRGIEFIQENESHQWDSWSENNPKSSSWIWQEVLRIFEVFQLLIMYYVIDE